MGTFYKVAGVATAELFDGTEAMADILVAAYPGIISIAKSESQYTILSGNNEITPGDTDVAADFVINEAGDLVTPAVVTLSVTNECTEDGTISISILGDTPISVAVTTAMDSYTKVATAIRAAVTSKWVLTGTGVDVIFTQAQAYDAILDVLDEKREIKNAYKGFYISFVTTCDDLGVETDSVEVLPKAIFEKFYFDQLV